MPWLLSMGVGKVRAGEGMGYVHGIGGEGVVSCLYMLGDFILRSSFSEKSLANPRQVTSIGKSSWV